MRINDDKYRSLCRPFDRIQDDGLTKERTMRYPRPALDSAAPRFAGSLIADRLPPEVSVQADLSKTIVGRNMPQLLYINERFGHDATIVLDSGDACWISVGKKGVLIRSHKHSFWGGLLGGLFGPKLYEERDVYQALRVAQALTATYPPVPQIGCKDVILKAFCTAVWHCSSPARVKVALDEPARPEE